MEEKLKQEIAKVVRKALDEWKKTHKDDTIKQTKTGGARGRTPKTK